MTGPSPMTACTDTALKVRTKAVKAMTFSKTKAS